MLLGLFHLVPSECCNALHDGATRKHASHGSRAVCGSMPQLRHHHALNLTIATIDPGVAGHYVQPAACVSTADVTTGAASDCQQGSLQGRQHVKRGKKDRADLGARGSYI